MILIDSDALKEKVQEARDCLGNTVDDLPKYLAVEMMKIFINEAPTIDAVEVVRCKDCTHYGNDCVLLFPADGYCYDGERRGEGRRRGC